MVDRTQIRPGLSEELRFSQEPYVETRSTFGNGLDFGLQNNRAAVEDDDDEVIGADVSSDNTVRMGDYNSEDEQRGNQSASPDFPQAADDSVESGSELECDIASSNGSETA